MQAQLTANAQAQCPIQELEQIESAIHASHQWIATLQGRRDMLTAELDRLTRPLLAHSKGSQLMMICPGLDYSGVTVKD